MSKASRPSRWTVILAFGLVYLFWGSTYLAIDVAVQTIPPGLMCGIRFSIAGFVMLVVCAATGRTIFYSPRQIVRAAIVGLLLLMGGNLTLSYAEQTVSSGFAALVIASTPLWFLVGSVLSKRWQSGMDVFSSTGWQVLAAGVGNLIFAFLFETRQQVAWSTRSIAAVGYLIVCGSWIGYTAYIYLLEHVPTSKVSTYAYVNPVVAVFLGWLILHENVDRFILMGSAIVVSEAIPAAKASGD
jgi:drug/metabolite transporter (DMT)-like permease